MNTANSSRSLVLRKAGLVTLGVLVTAAMGVGLGMAVFPQRIAAASSVNDVDLSLLSQDQAKKRLQEWWSVRSNEKLTLLGPDTAADPIEATIAEIGVRLDVDATLAQLPLDTFEEWAERTAQRAQPALESYRPVYDFSEVDEELLNSVISQTSPPLAPAKVTLSEAGEIIYTPEVSVMTLVLAESLDSLRDAIDLGDECKLSATFATKLVPDNDLYKIKDVVSTFSTKFNQYQRSRSENLRVAAEKLNGVILMPGDEFSFNEFVGMRTQENGFKLAGVYRRGKHDIDYGGGVCQVSTTLFNAAVFANLQIVKRGNHTFSVPYVPLGRDAAVSWGELDFKFVNSMDTPIAIVSKWVPGELSFSLLGTKDDSLEVKVTQQVTESWKHETKYVDDPKLAAGVEKEIEKGGKGHRAVTYKIVYKNGEEISRETLCRSYYPGGPKIIAKGPAKITPEPITPTLPPIGS